MLTLHVWTLQKKMETIVPEFPLHVLKETAIFVDITGFPNILFIVS